jgi:hypothetical protein
LEINKTVIVAYSWFSIFTLKNRPIKEAAHFKRHTNLHYSGTGIMGSNHHKARVIRFIIFYDKNFLFKLNSLKFNGIEIFVASFVSGFFMYETQKPEEHDTSVVAAPASLNVPVLSTVSEISKWSIHYYGSTTANFL